MIRALSCRWYRLLDHAAIVTPLRERAARHQDRCARCQARLRDADLIAGEMSRMSLPAPPSANLWRNLEQRLNRAEVTPAEARERVGIGAVQLGRAAMAAGLIVAFALAWHAWPSASSGPDGARSPAGIPAGPHPWRAAPVSLDVGRYVEEIGTTSAPTAFWRAYRARDANPRESFAGLDFEPVVPDELPHGLRLAYSKLLWDACCGTLQAHYESENTWLDVFQCHTGHPIDFGNADVGRRDVDGVACTAVGWRDGEIRGRSFARGDLSLVAVGNVDETVLDDVVRELSRERQVEPLAIDFDAVDLDGQPFRGADLRGQIVLMDFWAVWCAPCLDAFPKLTALAHDLADEPFELVGIALYSGDHDDVRGFLEPYTADYTVVVGDNDLSFRYGVIGYPTYLLIDPDGNVYKKYVGALPGLEERVKQDVEDLMARHGLN